MLGALITAFPGSPSNILAAATPSPTPSVVSADNASALPSWLLVSLLSVVGLVILSGFSLTAYSLSAPRSTLKNIIGKRGAKGAPEKFVTAQLIKTLATAARSGLAPGGRPWRSWGFRCSEWWSSPYSDYRGKAYATFEAKS